MESRHLEILSVQNALDCISENFNQKIFPGRACARNSLEKCAVRSPDGHYRAHIATVDHISKPPLSQNPPSAPVLGGRLRETAKKMRLTFSRPILLAGFTRSRDSSNSAALSREDTFNDKTFVITVFQIVSPM